MPNSRQTSDIDSPSSSLATNRRRSSITEHSFHGIDTSPGLSRESVTYVSGTFWVLCLGPLKAYDPDAVVDLLDADPLAGKRVRDADLFAVHADASASGHERIAIMQRVGQVGQADIRSR